MLAALSSLVDSISCPFGSVRRFCGVFLAGRARSTCSGQAHSFLAVVIVVMGAQLFTGCALSGIKKTMTIVQAFEGSGSISLESAAQKTSALLENGRQENGRYVYDKIDIFHDGKLTGANVEVHLTGSRPLIGPREESLIKAAGSEPQPTPHLSREQLEELNALLQLLLQEEPAQ